MQCKERVDLLEALRQSRLDGAADESTDESRKISKSGGVRRSRESGRGEADGERKEGYIGNGTIPAVNYPELSRPPPLPQRPSVLAHNSSTNAVVGRREEVGVSPR